jgi:hypothetical protein
MSIYFLSSDPKRLLASFDEAIQNHKVDTWRFVQNPQGNLYTHMSTQWKDKAYLRPDDTDPERLTFHVQNFQSSMVTRAVFAYYLGHLAETFIRDFSDQFIQAHLSSSPDPEDDGFLVGE